MMLLHLTANLYVIPKRTSEFYYKLGSSIRWTMNPLDRLTLDEAPLLFDEKPNPHLILMKQGVKAVISKSFERIHRSNLVGMGLIPLCFKQGEDADSLGLTGFEKYTIFMPTDPKAIKPGMDIVVKTDNGKEFKTTLRFDTQVSLSFIRSWFHANAQCKCSSTGSASTNVELVYR